MVERPVIEIRDGSFGYNHRNDTQVIIQKISCHFMKGELVGLVGLNGSGKSTLLRTIAGLIPMISGKVLLDGEELSGFSAMELSKKISIVLTERFGGFNLRLRDIVSAGQMPYTDSFHRLTKDHQAIIDQAMKDCQVYEYRDKAALQLSDGLFQKAMIARALAQQTKIILLDEPTAFLDFASRHALFRLLRRQTDEEGKCVLLSSHDLDLVLKYCGRIVVVAEGGIEIHSPSDIRTSSAFQSIAGGYL